MIRLPTELIEVLKQGGTVVVPSRQRAHAARLAYAAAELSQGRRVWATPDILSVDAWLAREVERHAASAGVSVPRLHSPAEEWFLWRQCTSEATGELELVNRGALAEALRRASAIAADFEIDIRKLARAARSDLADSPDRPRLERSAHNGSTSGVRSRAAESTEEGPATNERARFRGDADALATFPTESRATAAAFDGAAGTEAALLAEVQRAVDERCRALGAATVASQVPLLRARSAVGRAPIVASGFLVLPPRLRSLVVPVVGGVRGEARTPASGSTSDSTFGASVDARPRSSAVAVRDGTRAEAQPISGRDSRSDVGVDATSDVGFDTASDTASDTGANSGAAAPIVVIATDELDELERIAHWCKNHVDRDPNARLLVALPGAPGTRERLATLIRQAINPRAWLGLPQLGGPVAAAAEATAGIATRSGAPLARADESSTIEIANGAHAPHLSVARSGVAHSGETRSGAAPAAAANAPSATTRPTANARTPSAPPTTDASTPAASAPSTPAASAPSTPAASAPSTPAASAPSTPAASAPSTPAASAPSTPAASAPSTPAASAPSTPAASPSSTPAASAPSTSVIDSLVLIEGAAPLARVPAVAHALSTLAWLGGTPGDFEAVSNWLRAPYWKAPAAAARARLDLWLRERERMHFDLRDLVGALNAAPSALAAAAKDIAAQVNKATVVLGQGAASPREWSERFRSALEVFDWPGERTRGSGEQQTVVRFHELLDEFGQLAAATRSISRDNAIQWFSELAMRTAHRPADDDAVITISSAFAAPVVLYDAIWIAGLHAEAFPQPVQPDPFIPLAAQLTAGVPAASAAGRLHEAHALLSSWRASTNVLVLSAPARAEDLELLPSPLLAEWMRNPHAPASARGPEAARGREQAPSAAESAPHAAAGAVRPDTSQALGAHGTVSPPRAARGAPLAAPSTGAPPAVGALSATGGPPAAGALSATGGPPAAGALSATGAPPPRAALPSTGATVAPPSPTWLPTRIHRDNLLETFEDETGIPWSLDKPLPSGTRSLELQNNCPFRAYAEMRLGSTPLDAPEPGIAADMRGQLLHAALQKLWQRLRDSQGLASLSDVALDAAIHRSVEEAANELASGAGGHRAKPAASNDAQGDLFGGDPNRSPALTRECRRAERLIRALCAVERERAPFRVENTEFNKTLTLNGAQLNMRIDRVDALESGGRAILDYKSGRRAIADWYGERPSHPQLLTYLAALGDDVEAMATVNVTAREVRFDGIASSSELLPKVKGVEAPFGTDPDEAWPFRRQEWVARVEQLAAAFVAGHAAVDPKPGACDYCHVASVCRIADRAAVASGDVDETTTGDPPDA